MKQTAVEWLVKQIETLIKNGYAFNPKFEEDIFNQAKEMEKQQIIDAANSENSVDINYGEQYYNEKFNK